MYISEKIGDEYKEWSCGVRNETTNELEKEGEYVYISSPTGTGKLILFLGNLQNMPLKMEKKYYTYIIESL